MQPERTRARSTGASQCRDLCIELSHATTETADLRSALESASTPVVTPLRPGEHSRRESSFPGTSAAQLGMYVGLASLSVLFVASLVGYFVTRAQSSVWKDETTPDLPGGLWLSSAALVLLSVALHYGEAGIRRNRPDRLVTGQGVAAGLALVFLALQVGNWSSVARAGLVGPPKSLYEFTFYMLTGLHALHVLGGIVPLLWVLGRAKSRNYSSSHHEGVRLIRQYWDFLLGVWCVLFAAISIGS
jgi:cytochrome c oxidase subunit 3